MKYDLEKPLFTLTVGEYIALNNQLISRFEKKIKVRKRMP
jgi:hypothetical protein